MIYVSGGCRSGKSSFAQELAESSEGSRVYVATCPRIDGEMDQRILKHQQDRKGANWSTVEEPYDLAHAVSTVCDFDVVLIDCLTLWVNNLQYRAEQQGSELTEAGVAEECDKVIAECRKHCGKIILVSNEVGMGLVPESALARRYRDLIGRCNQKFARAADEAIFVVSGLPLKLK